MSVKRFKCSYCGERKPADAFYLAKTTSRPIPYCKACNASAVLLFSYKTAIKREGTKAFVAKIAKEEHQLGLMLRALTDV